MTDLSPERRRELREMAEAHLDQSAGWVEGREILALLDLVDKLQGETDARGELLHRTARVLQAHNIEEEEFLALGLDPPLVPGIGLSRPWSEQ